MWPVAFAFAAFKVATVKAVPLLDVNTRNNFVSFPIVTARLASGYSSLQVSALSKATGLASAPAIREGVLVRV